MIKRTETSRFIGESIAQKALLNPAEYSSHLVNAGTFTPEPTRITGQEEQPIIHGFTAIGKYEYPTMLYISAPGFISKAIARFKRTEPQAALHLTIYQEPRPIIENESVSLRVAQIA